MRKLEVVNKMVIVEYSTSEQRDNGGYTHGVFTKDEFNNGPGCRYEEMNFDTLETAREFALDFEGVK